MKFTKNLGYLSKVFLTASKQFDLNNSFDINSLKIKKTDNKNKYNLILSSDNLKKLSEYCKKAESIESQVLGIIINTGCSLKEILGLEYNDIYIDRFQSFIAIRSNSLRKIKNINKIRTIPLIGVSLICGKYFFKTLINCKNNLVFEGEFDKLENSIKRILKKNTNSKSIMSLQKTLIARLLHINCPEEVILDLIGRSRKNSLYNREISLDIKKSWLEHLEYF